MPELMFPVRRADHFMYPEAMFRTRTRPSHGGVDCTPVVNNKPHPFYAPEPGLIIISSYAAGSAGNNVMLLGDWTGIRWWGGHLSRRDVKVGDRVRQGQVLGMTGTTGNSSGVHLHLEAHYPAINVEVNPWKWLANAPDIDGSRMPLAPTRQKAQQEYPKHQGGASRPALKPTIPKEIIMDKTIAYRRKSTGKVAIANPAGGFMWEVPDDMYLSLVGSLGIADVSSKAIRDLTDDQYRVLIQITQQGHDETILARYLTEASKSPAKTPAKPAKKTVKEIAREVLDGKWGTGDTRRAKLEAAGYSYAAVQAEVNRLL